MNLETVITKQQGIEAMQYVIANVSDDSFMDYVAHYLYDHYKSGFLGTSPVSEEISTMIDIWIEREPWVKAPPAFILTDNERTLIARQFSRILRD